MGYKYATPEEAAAAKKAQAAAFRAARKAGTWVRKNKVRSKRIAVKLGILTVEQESRKAREALRRTEREQQLQKGIERWGSAEAYERHLEALRERRKMIKAMSPEQKAAYQRQKSREDYAKNRERMQEYNRAWRRKQREAAMTPEQRERRELVKAKAARRQDDGIIRAIAVTLAGEVGATVDEMMVRMIETGTVDFLLRALASRRPKNDGELEKVMRDALPAARFFVDNEHAALTQPLAAH